MSCEEIRSRLSPYLDGELSEIECERVRRHVARCAGCLRLLQELELAASVLGSLAEVDPPSTLEAGLRRRIRRRAAGLATTVLLLALVALPIWMMTSLLLRPDLPLWAKLGFGASTACLSVSLALLIFHLLRRVHSLMVYGFLSGHSGEGSP